VASIGVHPEYRRKGIGKLLLDACEEELAMPKIRLVLRPSNKAAMHLYGGAGYNEVDSWRKYYANGEDGLIMEKNNNREP
jgi:ribosomal-protein-alanine N-acetyltransferase